MLLEHPGVITGIHSDKVIVQIEVETACLSCQAQTSCSLTEAATKTLEIKGPSDHFIMGEKVVVVMEHTQGYQAVFWGYILPFLWLVLVMAILFAFTKNELFSGLISLGSLGIYYLFLFFMQNTFEKKFHFSIKKVSR